MPKCGRSKRAAAAPGAVLLALLLLGGLALAVATICRGASVAATDDVLPVGNFSGAAPGALPAEWRALTFPNIRSHTRYTLVADAEAVQVVRADAAASASGLMRRIAVDAHAWPLLRWRWKAERIVDRGDVATRNGDDYAARVYVAFAYDPSRVSLFERAWYAATRIFYGEDPPQSGLNYIWDRKAPVGTVVPNAYTSRVRMIVVESGTAGIGTWLAYERNIPDDYRRAFGEEAPPISGIAIMTDTDNTGESVTAWYGNVELARPPH